LKGLLPSAKGGGNITKSIGAVLAGLLFIFATHTGTVAFWIYGPAWYLLALIALSLPYAWLGGRLFEYRTVRREG
jgi:hypothetical protein